MPKCLPRSYKVCWLENIIKSFIFFSLFISPFSSFLPCLLVPLCISQHIFSVLQRAQQNLIVQFGKMMLLAAVKLNFRYQADAVIQDKSGTESLMYFNPVTGWKWKCCRNYQASTYAHCPFPSFAGFPFFQLSLTFSKSSLLQFLVHQATTVGPNINRLHFWPEDQVHVKPFTTQTGGCFSGHHNMLHIMLVFGELLGPSCTIFISAGKKLKIASFHFKMYLVPVCQPFGDRKWWSSQKSTNSSWAKVPTGKSRIKKDICMFSFSCNQMQVLQIHCSPQGGN